MNIDLSAQEHIVELEAERDDLIVLNDLLSEQVNELQEENKVLREAVLRWKTRNRIEVA